MSSVNICYGRFYFRFVPPMPEEVEDKASWLLQRLQAECCEAGAWVENKGIVLALHHEAWKEKTAIGEFIINTFVL